LKEHSYACTGTLPYDLPPVTPGGQ
jgi:hypothetical protein